MKLTLIIVLMATGIAVSAGLLLWGPYITQNSSSIAIPAEQEDSPMIGIFPKEPIQDVAIEPPKKDAVPKLPEQDRVAEPPKQAIKQPSQQPVQEAPQIPQIIPNIARVGIPQNFVFKGALITIHRTLGNEALGSERARLNDTVLTLYPDIKNSLISLNDTTVQWVERCKRQFPEGANIGECGFGRPRLNLEILQEDMLNTSIQLFNTGPPREPNRFESRIERQYGSVIEYQGVRYLLLIDVLWEGM